MFILEALLRQTSCIWLLVLKLGEQSTVEGGVHVSSLFGSHSVSLSLGEFDGVRGSI